MTNNPTDIKNDNTSEGWRKITKTPNNYTATNPLFDSSENENSIKFSDIGINASYIYLPKIYVDDGLKMYGIT